MHTQLRELGYHGPKGSEQMKKKDSRCYLLAQCGMENEIENDTNPL